MKVVHLLRKPCSEGTVAANVLRHGTGALNIDASRVAHASAADLDAHQKMVEAIKARGGTMNNSWKNSSDLSGANNVSAGGRWPANLVLQHLPECEQTGTREEAGYSVNRFTDGAKPFGGGAGHSYESVPVPPSTVAVWACAEGCPVAALDEQSGEAAPKKERVGLRGGTVWHGRTGFGSPDKEGTWPADSGGGASRFFKQFGG